MSETAATLGFALGAFLLGLTFGASIGKAEATSCAKLTLPVESGRLFERRDAAAEDFGLPVRIVVESDGLVRTVDGRPLLDVSP